MAKQINPLKIGFQIVLFLILFNACDKKNSVGLNMSQNVKNYQQSLIDNAITGSNVAIVFKDGKKIVHSIVNSKKEGDMEITNETIFPIWSMSKPITIVSIMILNERGLINFNDPVSKYIPYFKDLKCEKGDLIYECDNELTIYHLLTHRSGYRYDNEKYSWWDYSYDDLDEFVKDVASHPVEFEPGTQYLYGINQAILGRVAEVVTGKNFYQFLNENIFTPLEMNDTKFFMTNDERKKFQILYRKLDGKLDFTFEFDENEYPEDNKTQLGGEGLVSTMDNYSKFCEMLLNKGVYNGKQIISEESIKIMTTPVSKGSMGGHPLSPRYHGLDESERRYYYGFDNAFSFFVLTNRYLDGTNSPEGIFGWAGYHNTHFWIDYKTNLYGLFMTRTTPFSWDIPKNFRSAVYNSLN